MRCRGVGPGRLSLELARYPTGARFPNVSTQDPCSCGFLLCELAVHTGQEARASKPAPPFCRRSWFAPLNFKGWVSFSNVRPCFLGSGCGPQAQRAEPGARRGSPPPSSASWQPPPDKYMSFIHSLIHAFIQDSIGPRSHTSPLQTQALIRPGGSNIPLRSECTPAP